MPQYVIDTPAGFAAAGFDAEWLLTNGSGAFSSSTVTGCNTRRYHGLLCAATIPPVGRVMALNRVSESLHLPGVPLPIELSVNQFADVLIPRGDLLLKRFSTFQTAKWEYESAGIVVTKELQLLWQRNVIGLRYTVDPGPHASVEFRVQPFVSLRDFHSLLRADARHCEITRAQHSCLVRRHGHALLLRSAEMEFVGHTDWWYGFTYVKETERGQDDTEDLVTPGTFFAVVTQPTNITLWAGLEPDAVLDWDKEISRKSVAVAVPEMPTKTQQRLAQAAADFVVARHNPDGVSGTTVIAGYPWFSDWGRDTMIALPGLLLRTGKFDQAGRVLSVFSRYVSEGMIPNLFDDYTNEPQYNTVDASLWFVHAVFEYLRHSRDQETFDSVLRPACEEIIAGYRAGTRYGIHADPADGLITQGDAQTQLTWMDAKANGVVFTPRQGKPVEINALWHHALMLMGHTDEASRVADSFRQAFWISAERGLADVVNDAGRDESVRPNQIFAVSLPNSPLLPDQQAAVVEVVRRELLSPMGLHSLAPSDRRYLPRYTGPRFERDAAYHNGAVWPWLIGGFLDAYLRVHQRSADARNQARLWLQPLVDELETGCLGSIDELYEAAPPHRRVGCFAQAFSVAEVLRLAVELEM